MATVYDQCSASFNGTENVLRCISDQFQGDVKNDTVNVQNWILVLTGALVFFMQAGFAMLCAGCVRKKNVQNTMLKNLLDACGGAVGFFAVGYAFSFGGQDDRTDITFIGTQNFFLMGGVNPALWFFQYAFCATSVTIIAGTLAERCQMAAYLCYSVFMTGFVYPVIAHAVWSNNGFLSAFSVNPPRGIGAIDFAGSGVVHLTGGTTALIATYILGSRKGRFYDHRGKPLKVPKVFPGHSIALQLMGTMVLWFGWYGFNPGSAVLLPKAESTGAVAATAAVNTTLAAAAGVVSALFTQLFIMERKTGEYSFDLTMAMNGCLSGLVAITAPCGTIPHWAAIIVGIVSGWLYMWGSSTLIKFRLDDAVDAIPVHFMNGLWGLLAVGIFSSPEETQAAFGTDEHLGLLYLFNRDTDVALFVNQLLEILFIMGWTTGTMLPFFLWLNYMGWFRSDSLEELVGLDISYHGGRPSHMDDGGQDDDVKEEHVRAFQNRRGELRKRRTGDDDGDFDGDESWADLSNAQGPESTSYDLDATRNPRLSRQPARDEQGPPEESPSHRAMPNMGEVFSYDGVSSYTERTEL